MADIPVGIPWGVVVGNLGAIISDTSDEGRVPNVEELTGTATLRPVTADETGTTTFPLEWIQFPEHGIYRLRTLVCPIIGGKLYPPDTTVDTLPVEHGVPVIASFQPAGIPAVVQWEVTFNLDGTDTQPYTRLISVPADGVVDLAGQLGESPQPGVVAVTTTEATTRAVAAADRAETASEAAGQSASSASGSASSAADALAQMQKGVPGGVAELDAAGLLPETRVPERLTTDALSATIDEAILGVRVGARGGLRVVPWGDSTSAANSARFPATSWGNRDFWAWGHVLSGGAFQYVQNGAVAGDDTSEALPRFSADIAAWEPNVVPIQFGINDAVTGLAPATFIANIKQMIALVRSIDATPWLCTVSGNVDAPTTVTVRNFISEYNQRIRALAATEGLPVLDIARIMTDPLDGTIPDVYDLDGTHQNAAGAKAIGQAIADLVAANLPQWSPPLPVASNDPKNLIVNGLFMASGPGAGAPEGWAFTGGTPSIVAGGPGDQGRWARLADAAVETANIRYIRPGTPPSGLAAGDRVRFVGRLRVVNGTSVATTRLMMILNGTAGAQVTYVLGDITADVDGAFCIDAQVPAGYSAVQWQLARIVTTAGTGYAEIAQVGCYNLTTLGID